MKRNYKCEIICGNELSKSYPESLPFDNPVAVFKGVCGDGEQRAIPLSLNTLSKHMLILGGIGTGKTNTFNSIISNIKPTMTEDDVMIIFDTKGDFLHEFYSSGDIVISNDDYIETTDEYEYWNVFSELEQGPHLLEDISEIARMIFAEACEKTNQIFFPNAARGIFEACMYHFMQENPGYRSNYWLADYIKSITGAEARAMLEKYPEFRAMVSYISADDSAQTQGVLSELQQVVRDVFVGNFAKVGTIALSNLVKEKGGKTIFIEYDLKRGKTLAPIYSLMFDMAIKTALGRSDKKGNVYLITDEFRLLPHLEHIDDAVNFGRSLGLKFIMGIQNVEQIYENYGEERARSILSGFQSLVAFRMNDASSRRYVQDFFGKNRKVEAYTPLIAAKGLVEETREGSVVEDWDIIKLKTGEAIIGLPEQEPFIYHFALFKSSNEK